VDSPQSDRSQWFAQEVMPLNTTLKAYLRGAFPAVRDVDDVVQESLLRTWQARSREPIRSAKAFLFTVARRLALDGIRREKRSPVVAVGNPVVLNVIEEGAGVADRVAAGEMVELVADALVALPPRCRAVVMLYKLKCLSRSEVARQLGISEKTVDEQAARGVRRLESLLRARGVFGHDVP
jgi:RNA polymerase sigma-70 factor (ECF subfamily)